MSTSAPLMHANAARPAPIFLNPNGQTVEEQRDMLAKMVDANNWQGKVEPYARCITITPQLAQHVLDDYKRLNRKVSTAKINTYAERMETGDWFGLTGQTIIFSKTGVLLDGYQRLAAVVKSGKKFRVLAVFGVEDSAFSFLDMGRKRTNANVLEALGVPHAGVVAAAIRWLGILSSESPHNRGLSFENEEIRALWQDRYEGDSAFAHAVGLARDVSKETMAKGQRFFPAGPLAAFFYLYGSPGPAQWGKVLSFADAMKKDGPRARSTPAKLMKEVQARVLRAKGRLHENIRNIMIARALSRYMTGSTEIRSSRTMRIPSCRSSARCRRTSRSDRNYLGPGWPSAGWGSNPRDPATTFNRRQNGEEQKAAGDRLTAARRATRSRTAHQRSRHQGSQARRQQKLRCRARALPTGGLQVGAGLEDEDLRVRARRLDGALHHAGRALCRVDDLRPGRPDAGRRLHFARAEGRAAAGLPRQTARAAPHRQAAAQDAHHREGARRRTAWAEPVPLADGRLMRQCGDCQLCCRLMPVSDGVLVNGAPIPGGLHKPANKRCIHQKHGVGCKVHGTLEMPFSCSIWNCRWLANDDTADLPRPDRAHYVIDIMPDFVVGRHDETGVEQEFEVIQIWMDPEHEAARYDPALLRYIERQGKAALIRFNERDGIFMAPPSVTGEGWWEKRSTAVGDKPTTLNERAAKLGYKIEFSEETSATGMTETRLVAPNGRVITIAAKPPE